MAAFGVCVSGGDWLAASVPFCGCNVVIMRCPFALPPALGGPAEEYVDPERIGSQMTLCRPSHAGLCDSLDGASGLLVLLKPSGLLFVYGGC